MLAGSWVSPLAQDRPLNCWGSTSRVGLLPFLQALLTPAHKVVHHAMLSTLCVTKAVTLASKALQPGAHTWSTAGWTWAPASAPPWGVTLGISIVTKPGDLGL